MCAAARDRSVSPFSIHPTSIEVCAAVSALCHSRSSRWPWLQSRSRGCAILATSVCPSRGESGDSLTRHSMVGAGLHGRLGAISRLRMWPQISWKPQETFVHEFLARDVGRPSGHPSHLYDFLMAHHSQPLVLGEHKPWNHKMSIVRRISLRRRSSS